MPQLLSVSQRASGTRGNYDETALDKTEEEKKTLDKTKQKIELQEYLDKPKGIDRTEWKIHDDFKFQFTYHLIFNKD